MTVDDLFADVPEERRRLMGRVKAKDTKPELLVRRALHAMGKRFRLQRRDLPGRPDIVLPKYKTAIFVHGCFWHRHQGCRGATTPKTRTAFWIDKFDTNVGRDRAAEDALRTAGWNVLVIWECQTKDRGALASMLTAHFGTLTNPVEEVGPWPKSSCRASSAAWSASAPTRACSSPPQASAPAPPSSCAT